MTNGKVPHEEVRHPPTANGSSTTDPSKQKAPQQPGPQPQEPKPQKEQKPSTPSPNPPPPTPETAPQAHANGGLPAAAPADPAEWTEEQQAMLVKALKEIGKEVLDRYRQVEQA